MRRLKQAGALCGLVVTLLPAVALLVSGCGRKDAPGQAGYYTGPKSAKPGPSGNAGGGAR